MARKTRPGPRQRKAIQKRKESFKASIGVHKLIAQYERELKSTAYKAQADKLANEIARLKLVIESGSNAEKLKAKNILSDRPNIGSSLTHKKGKSGDWVNVYQGGAPGLKK